ncbi:hypothetical protein [Candidatus Lokiarchaeum ossiferum]|uniref:hypothetical protein n=1 Tax=Candidatus Lokiarchaeum ossiferum TaxID=2951803 RepID=UPI00352BEFF6
MDINKLTTKEELKIVFRRIKPLLLSHHPDCEKFHDHVLHIGRNRFCIGCFVGYPSILLSFLISNFLIFPITDKNLHIWLLVIGFLLFGTLGLSITRLTEIKVIKIGQKITNGTGIGIIVSFFLNFFEIKSFFQIIFLIWGICAVLIIPVAFIRFRSMEKQCDQCEWKEDSSKCPIKDFLPTILNESRIEEKTPE